MACYCDIHYSSTFNYVWQGHGSSCQTIFVKMLKIIKVIHLRVTEHADAKNGIFWQKYTKHTLQIDLGYFTDDFLKV